MNRHAIVSTRIGDLTLVADDDVLVGVYFPHHWVKPSLETLGERVEATDPFIAAVAEQLESYFAGSRVSFDVPTRLHGDEFQRRVWTVLEEIPYGETTTYGELAARLGKTGHAARAVGLANGRNPIAIVVPCHRVVGAGGKLIGYGGGLDRKQRLLALEQASLF